MDEKKHVIDITAELKKREVTLKLERAWDSVKQFCSTNKEWVLGVGVPLLIGTGAKLVANAKRSSTKREMDHLKNNYVWDNRNGIYFETRRKMTNGEKVEFATRREHGESAADILRDMRILK